MASQLVEVMELISTALSTEFSFQTVQKPKYEAALKAARARVRDSRGKEYVITVSDGE
jgi:hypothetical protein